MFRFFKKNIREFFKIMKETRQSRYHNNDFTANCTLEKQVVLFAGARVATKSL